MNQTKTLPIRLFTRINSFSDRMEPKNDANTNTSSSVILQNEKSKYCSKGSKIKEFKIGRSLLSFKEQLVILYVKIKIEQF